MGVLRHARLTRRPHVWHVREIVWQSGLVRRLERRLARLADRVVVTSAAVGAMFRDATGALAPNVRVVPNGVDTELFRPRPAAEARAELGLPEGLLFACVGRLNRAKGTHHAIRALARLGEAADARLVGVGDGEEAESPRRLAAQVVGRNERDLSNWKLAGRWDRMRRF